MAGSNPNITATITAVDHATQTLQNVAELSKRITKETNSALAQSAIGAHSSIASEVAAVQSRMSALKSAASETALAIGVSFGGMATSVIHKSFEVGMAIERQMAKMRSFTDASAKDIARVRDLADTEGARLPGGNVGFVEAARAASMSGVRPELVGIAAAHGMMFGYETGDDPARATENLLSHAAMLQDIRDDRNRPIPPREATGPQLEGALTHAQNLLIEINKQAPGNLGDVYEGFKFGAPAAIGAHVGAPELAALYTQLAEHGIRGSEAGVAARAGFASLEAPTAKGRMTAAALGVDIDKYRVIDPAMMSADKILNGLAQRVGHDKAEHIRAPVAAAVDQFQHDHDTHKFNDELTRNIQHLAKNLQDNVRASNLGRDVMTPFVKAIDFTGFVKALKDSGAQAGAFNQIFGAKMGGKLIVLDGDRLSELSRVFDKAQGSNNYSKSVEEYENNPAGRFGHMTGSISALYDRVFQANQPLMDRIMSLTTAAAESASRHPNASAAVFDTAAVAGFVAALRVASKVLQALAGGRVVAGASEALTGAGIAARGIPVAAGGASLGSVGLVAGAGAVALGGLFYGLKKYREAHPEEFHARARAAYDDHTFGPFRHLVTPPGRNQGWRGHFELGKDDRDRLDLIRRASPEPRQVGTSRFAQSPLMIGGRRVFGYEGSGAIATGGINHEATPVKVIEKVIDAFSFLSKSIGTLHPSESGNRSPFGTLEKITVAPSTVTGDVKGEATIMQTIRVEPSPLLIATLQGAQAALKLNLNGKLGQTMKGSNAAVPSVAPGLSTFRPTVSGR